MAAWDGAVVFKAFLGFEVLLGFLGGEQVVRCRCSASQHARAETSQQQLCVAQLIL